MNPIIEKLPENYKPFVIARQEPQMRVLTANQVKAGIAKILSQASFDMGSPMSADREILTFQTEACFKELSFKFSTLTLSELRNAFAMGIRNEFGQYFGMCPKTYHQFIKAYYELPGRFKAQEAYLKLGNAKEPGTEDKSAPPNPEGQKKVIEILSQYVTKPDYSKKGLELKPRPKIVKSERDKFIQQCFNDFFELLKKDAIKTDGGEPTRFVMIEGKPMDEAEYAQLKLKQYDLNTTSTP